MGSVISYVGYLVKCFIIKTSGTDFKIKEPEETTKRYMMIFRQLLGVDRDQELNEGYEALSFNNG
jgi:hypothetical protein